MKALYPSLYQINTRLWLAEISRVIGRPARLDDIPDAELDLLGDKGFDWIYLLSLWRVSEASCRVAKENQELRKECLAVLPDLRDKDIGGSGFAIGGYEVNPAVGDTASLARLRDRLHKRGLKLMLDFVPNHVGLDHPWVKEHPEYFITGTESDLANAPQNYVRIKNSKGKIILAHGRDPNFPGWSDTLQLDYSNPATPEAMKEELRKIAALSDGVRCDMAMLLLPEVFERTWNRKIQPFWPQVIGQIREQFPEFCFLAEVYWNLEWTLQKQEFDYTYDKRLYDRLRGKNSRTVREHFRAGLDFQNKLVRFLENHDEERAAAAFDGKIHQAAAVITYLSPGMRFFHQGQLEGRKIRIPNQLVRAPKEAPDHGLRDFYDKLLALLSQWAIREGRWRLLECVPAWEGNWTSDSFLSFAWEGSPGERFLLGVNYSGHQSQCYVRLPYPDLSGKKLLLKDRMGTVQFDRIGKDLYSQGLYLDLAPWAYHVFEIKRTDGK